MDKTTMVSTNVILPNHVADVSQLVRKQTLPIVCDNPTIALAGNKMTGLSASNHARNLNQLD